MRKHFIYGVVAVAALGLAACSSDDVIDEVANPEVNEQVTEGEEVFQVFNFKTKSGDKVSNSANASRSMNDVDEYTRPIGAYRLNHIYMLGLKPLYESQPKPEDINKAVKVKYSNAAEDVQIAKHKIVDQKYVLKYKNAKELTTVVPGYSKSGQITFVQNGNEVTVDLSIFDLKDLQSGKRIPLNKFGFGAQKMVGNLRGTTLRYASWNPKDPEMPVGNEEGLHGRYASMPKFDTGGDQFLEKTLFGEFESQKNVVSECKDEYFSSDEYLVAADDNNFYLLEVVNVENELGGYYKVRKYPIRGSQESTANPESLTLNRLTAVVNASFMLIDKDYYGYYEKTSEDWTLKAFQKKFGLSLKELASPYAAIDGVNTHFYLNEDEKIDKYAKPGRLIMWAENYRLKPEYASLKEYMPKQSMHLNYDYASGNLEKGGYGLKGNHYSVIFQGLQDDTRDQAITFWVEHGNAEEGYAHVKIKARIPSNSGVAFNKNITHELMVLVPAEEYVDAVKASKRYPISESQRTSQIGTRSNSIGEIEYTEIELPSSCVVIK